MNYCLRLTALILNNKKKSLSNNFVHIFISETNSELFEKGRLVVFTNDFFTVYQDTATGEMNISLNEIGKLIFEKKNEKKKFKSLFIWEKIN